VSPHETTRKALEARCILSASWQAECAERPLQAAARLMSEIPEYNGWSVGGGKRARPHYRRTGEQRVRHSGKKAFDLAAVKKGLQENLKGH
jgi:hypothetical protein